MRRLFNQQLCGHALEGSCTAIVSMMCDDAKRLVASMLAKSLRKTCCQERPRKAANERRPHRPSPATLTMSQWDRRKLGILGNWTCCSKRAARTFPGTPYWRREPIIHFCFECQWWQPGSRQGEKSVKNYHGQWILKNEITDTGLGGCLLHHAADGWVQTKVPAALQCHEEKHLHTRSTQYLLFEDM